MKKEMTVPSAVVMPMATSFSNISGRTSHRNQALFFTSSPFVPQVLVYFRRFASHLKCETRNQMRERCRWTVHDS